VQHWTGWQRTLLFVLYSVGLWYVGSRANAAIYGHPSSRTLTTLDAGNAGAHILLWAGVAVLWGLGSWFILASERGRDT
jgi:hypothetical protein